MILQSINVYAQSRKAKDTMYYVFFPNSITGRIYSSQKYTNFRVKPRNKPSYQYLPSTSLNFGIGATYHNLSINIGYGFGLSKNKNAEKGKTKYLDLQTQFYSLKWVNDLNAQFYKGYHFELDNDGKDKTYYYRPDIKVTLIGFSRYRVFNSNRFSYRASFLQNEWQKRSAGSLLLGAEAYYGLIRADSSFIPVKDGENIAQKNITKVNYLSIGPGGGYAHTFVVAEHFFLTGSLTGNLNFSYTTEHFENNKSSRFAINPALRFRLAAGYNSRYWNISATWIANSLPFKGSNQNYTIDAGNYRFFIVKRFAPGKKLKKHLKKMDRIIKEFNNPKHLIEQL